MVDVRIGVLTGGGDCPGLNAVIRAVVVKGARSFGDDFVGFLDGWRGVLDDEAVELDVERCRDLLPTGGTILGTSRTNPFAHENGLDQLRRVFRARELGALIVIGGEDTLGVAAILHESGTSVVGVPKTIDNDLSGTEVTFGFDTAVQVATDAIDRLRTTAESHHRVIVCEVMGRHAGWIALHAGIAGGAAEILIPEEPFDIEAVCDRIRKRHSGGRFSSVVVVSEGAMPREPLEGIGTPAIDSDAQVDQFGHARLGGVSNVLAAEIERRTGYESRVTILGHIQRGGTPTAYDRVLATRFGVAAIEAVHDGAFGTMVALQGGEIVRVPLTESARVPKNADPVLAHDVADVFLG